MLSFSRNIPLDAQMAVGTNMRGNGSLEEKEEVEEIWKILESICL